MKLNQQLKSLFYHVFVIIKNNQWKLMADFCQTVIKL